MKKGIWVIKLIAFMCILALCTNNISVLLKDKENYLKYDWFYEEEEPFDVLFFGSSRMLNAVHPMELWQEYGITSYNMAQHSETTMVSYWQMKNAFQYNVPKVAVIDVSLFSGEKVKAEDVKMKSYLHKSMDHMPLTPLKYTAVKELTEDVDILEYLFPITIYHNRWNELDQNDFYMEMSGRMGAEARVNIAPVERIEWSNHEQIENFDTELVKLDAMIELCKAKEVEVIFTCMPSVEVTGNRAVCGVINYLEVYAKEHGAEFLNFAKQDEFINYATDFFDNSHLNPSGGYKLTDKLGEFLTGNYTFKEKSLDTMLRWEKYEENYKDVKVAALGHIRNKGNVSNYLILLNDDDYTYDIAMSQESDIETYQIGEVLMELGVSEDDILWGGTDQGVLITVYDKMSGEVLDEAAFK